MWPNTDVPRRSGCFAFLGDFYFRDEEDSRQRARASQFLAGRSRRVSWHGHLALSSETSGRIGVAEVCGQDSLGSGFIGGTPALRASRKDARNSESVEMAQARVSHMVRPVAREEGKPRRSRRTATVYGRAPGRRGRQPPAPNSLADHATARSHFRPMPISLMRAFTAPSERPGRLSDWRIENRPLDQRRESKSRGPNHRHHRTKRATRRLCPARRACLLGASQRRPFRRTAHRAARLGDQRRREPRETHSGRHRRLKRDWCESCPHGWSLHSLAECSSRGAGAAPTRPRPPTACSLSAQRLRRWPRRPASRSSRSHRPSRRKRRPNSRKSAGYPPAVTRLR